MSCFDFFERCQWCKTYLTKKEQHSYNTNEGNWVAWCGLDKYATCSKCMKTMCDICKGPCEDICTKCHKVCHSYMCDGYTDECTHRCACNNPAKDGLVAVPYEITLENMQNYTKKRLQDENVKYGLARCENETKDKTVAKLKSHLEKLGTQTTCKLKLDDDLEFDYSYPQGKTRLHLNKIINDFFRDE